MEWTVRTGAFLWNELLSTNRSRIRCLASMLLAGSVGCSKGPAAPSHAGGNPPRREDPWNVVILTLDTTRRDYVGFHGRSPSPTPVLDRLAAESVIFEDAYTVAPLTLPAHASLMTGLYPSSHGVRDNSSFVLSEQALTLAEVLRAAGYHTGATVAAAVLDSGFGIGQGFDRFLCPQRGPNQSSPHYLERNAAEMAEQACREIERLPEPFFFWLHLFDPHYPYAPPDPDLAILPGESMISFQRRLYEAEIAFMDRQIGRVVDLLRSRPSWARTVVMVGSDHGESLQEGRENTHGVFIQDVTMRVPLLLRHPDLPPRRFTAPVSLVDMMPTILALLGQSEAAEPMDGINLLPLLREEQVPDPARRLALESYYVYWNFRWAPFEGGVDRAGKFIHSHRDELYDRVADPGEEHNLVDQRPAEHAAWREAVESMFAAPSRYPARGQNMGNGRIADLEALGYVVSESTPDTERPDFAVLADATAKQEMVRKISDVLAAQRDERHDEALELMEWLCQEEPGSAYFHDQLGSALLRLRPDRWEESREHLLRAAELGLNRATTYYNLGWLAIQRAREARRQRESLPPDAPDEQVRGLRQQERGFEEDAARRFRETLQREPHYAEALDQLARLLQADAERHAQRGSPAEAVLVYDEVIDLLQRYLRSVPASDPSGPAQQAALARCQSRRAALEQP